MGTRKTMKSLKNQGTGFNKQDKTLRQKAEQFCKYWRNNSESENSGYQNYWRMLLHDVFGIEQPESRIRFQVNVKIKGRRKPKTLDAWIPETKVLIEHKSRDKKLDAPQFDHEGKTPYEQAKEYDDNRPFGQKARWIITCNFDEIWLYDCENPTKDPEKIKLNDLPSEINRLSFLVDKSIDEIRAKEKELSFKAGKIIGELYEKLRNRYEDPNSEETLKFLNRLCVRLVFILYAEDSDVFPKDAFRNLVNSKAAGDLHRWLLELFKALNTPEEERSSYLEPEIKVFPYTNGGLFKDVSDEEIPQIDDEIKDLLLKSSDFDWHDISPTIFGAVFESTLDPKTRRKGGMVYTSVENIHKVIDPLFLNDLKGEWEYTKCDPNITRRRIRAKAFQRKLASLSFLDPACGSGNFLTETYICLRRLENEAIVVGEKMKPGEFQLDLGDLVMVNIDQFRGIEIDDFAVSVAKTALWIAEAQMLHETAEILHCDPIYLPLKDYNGIVENNALRIKWPKTDFIMGNPPFVGARNKDKDQAVDMEYVFGKKWKGFGNLDYVTAWYKKAAEMKVSTAFVSTNSICQGDVSILWKPLFEEYGVEIDFCWRTFCWNSEAAETAHVHVIIVGFHAGESLKREKIICDKNSVPAKYINAYLMDFPNVWIASRENPISKSPQLVTGSMPNDNYGRLSKWSPAEKEAVIKRYPDFAQCFRRFVGADEAIDGIERYCLWLLNTSLNIRLCPPIYDAVKSVYDKRKDSSRKETKALAKTPMLFGEIRQPEKGEYLLIPRHSSENREYVPMAFLNASVIAGDSTLIIPSATSYHFGVLTSSVHMAWIRVVAGRLEMRYRYSAQIVYNNFPWPKLKPSSPLTKKISQTAEKIIAVRNKHKDSSLAALYDNLTMPEDLRAAHKDNDKAVLEAYGLSPDTPESAIVEHLFKLYLELTREK